MSKSVAQPTAKHTEFKTLWTKCRDAVAGHDKVQEKGEAYLPKLSGQEEDDYNKYKNQALFYPATGRTYKGYKGLVFRKEPDINGDPISDFVEDCTLSGTSLKAFAKDAVAEELKTSRFGVLVDYPTVGKDSNMSQAEAEEQGIRPFLVSYKAEDIIGDPQTIQMGGRTVLGKIRLEETYKQQDPEDEFNQEQKKRIRVLDLTNEHPFDVGGKVYRQRVFKPVEEDGDEWAEDPDSRWYPKMEGQPIREIPFYMVGGYEYRTPHLIDLVNVNLSHYVAYADHRAGVSKTTRPQITVTGVSDDELPSVMVMGVGIWNTGNTEAEWKMLEYTGTGLEASENLLESLKENMAHIGAQFLMPENTNEQTATEFVIKKQGENSALSEVSGLVSQCLTDAMQFAARWMGVADPEEVNIKLNTDFIPFDMAVEDMVKLWGLVQSGGLMEDDYLWNLSQGERLDPSIEDDERMSKMQTEPPTGMNFNGNEGE